MNKLKFDVQNREGKKETITVKVDPYQKEFDLADAINPKAQTDSTVLLKGKFVILKYQEIEPLNIGTIPINSYSIMIKDVQSKKNQMCQIFIYDTFYLDIQTSTKSSAKKQQRTVGIIQRLLQDYEQLYFEQEKMNQKTLGEKKVGKIRTDVCKILGEKESTIHQYQREMKLAEQFYYNTQLHQDDKIGRLYNYTKEITSVISSFHKQQKKFIEADQLINFIQMLQNQIKIDHPNCCLNRLQQQIDLNRIMQVSNEKIHKLFKKQSHQKQSNNIQSLRNPQQNLNTEQNNNIPSIPSISMFNEQTINIGNKDEVLYCDNESQFQTELKITKLLQGDQDSIFQQDETDYDQDSMTLYLDDTEFQNKEYDSLSILGDLRNDE